MQSVIGLPIDSIAERMSSPANFVGIDVGNIDGAAIMWVTANPSGDMPTPRMVAVT
jgi:hypothetical protein